MDSELNHPWRRPTDEEFLALWYRGLSDYCVYENMGRRPAFFSRTRVMRKKIWFWDNPFIRLILYHCQWGLLLTSYSLMGTLVIGMLRGWGIAQGTPFKDSWLIGIFLLSILLLFILSIGKLSGLQPNLMEYTRFLKALLNNDNPDLSDVTRMRNLRTQVFPWAMKQGYIAFIAKDNRWVLTDRFWEIQIGRGK